ncbi:Hypothetical protein PBC10988_0350 [Planctomycetales bacterium 10988]|nr:Hypothetical protein PBC10988_0350 [Planctomycetales bacterium 10988]
MKRAKSMRCVAIIFGICGGLIAFSASQASSQSLPLMLQTDWESTIPSQPAGFQSWDQSKFTRASIRLEEEVVDLVQSLREGRHHPRYFFQTLEKLHSIKGRVDSRWDDLLAHRKNLTRYVQETGEEGCLRNYLLLLNEMVDLSGRINFEVMQGVSLTAFSFARYAPLREQLINALLYWKSPAGAEVMASTLVDPEPQNPQGVEPLTNGMKQKVIQLAEVTGSQTAVSYLGEMIYLQQGTPETQLLAAEAIRTLGIPQSRRPGVPNGRYGPDYTAEHLQSWLGRLSLDSFSTEDQARFLEVMEWLGECKEEGVPTDSYPIGNGSVKPGDWLLIRNPSPYNLFTNLSPGLFTHVGVITEEVGTDGKRRMVLVEMREKGKIIPASSLDSYLKQVRFYCVMRHPDLEVARTMASVANSIIGNEMEFDLAFQTSRVSDYLGKSLADRKIHTYCAGLLLLCSQETTAPRESFFPFTERVISPLVRDNLASFGLTLGENFVSPTGPIFSTEMDLVLRREVLYDPSKEIEQAVFDHFGSELIERPISPKQDFYQSLRLRLAEMSQGNPLLAQALAATANVRADIDMVSAAKAVAVVEAIDAIAYGASADYRLAWTAVRGPASDALEASETYSKEELAKIEAFRQTFSELRQRYLTEDLSIRETRLTLVEEFIQRGKRQVEARFFEAPNSQ